MPTAEKIVRFYDTVLIDEYGVRHSVEQTFWAELLDAFQRWSQVSRSGTVNEVAYFGHAAFPKQPALPHLQIERIRDLDEQLNRSNITSGDVEPLDFDDPDERVSEPTYVVPFGHYGRVAIMSPAVQGTRPETLGRWLTFVLDLVPQGLSLEFIPVVDPSVLQRILSASGAVMLEVHVDAGASIPSGGAEVGEAFRTAQSQALEDARLTLRWSLDRSGGSSSVREALQRGALWVAQNGFSSNAKVKLVNLGQDGRLVRDDLRGIFEDRITKHVSFPTQRGQRTPDEVIIQAIGNAILEFTREAAASGLPAAGTQSTARVSLERE